MDIFCEYLVKRKKSSSEKAMTAAIVFGGIVLSIVLLLVAFPVLSRLLPKVAAIVFPVVIILWYIIFSLCKMYSVEFEYAITEGDIDIDKIINKSKRTKILSIRLRKFEIIAPVLSDKYSEEYKSLQKVDCSANLEPSATYFAVYTDENERKCLLFDPSQKMLDITEKYCPDKFFRG